MVGMLLGNLCTEGKVGIDSPATDLASLSTEAGGGREMAEAEISPDSPSGPSEKGTDFLWR